MAAFDMKWKLLEVKLTTLTFAARKAWGLTVANNCCLGSQSGRAVAQRTQPIEERVRGQIEVVFLPKWSGNRA